MHRKGPKEKGDWVWGDELWGVALDRDWGSTARIGHGGKELSIERARFCVPESFVPFISVFILFLIFPKELCFTLGV